MSSHRQRRSWRKCLATKIINSDSGQWQPGSTVIEPGIDFIDLWRVDLSNPDLEQPAILAHDENRRAEKFAFDAGRNNYVRSRCTLRRILGGCLNYPAEKIEFRYNEHDKPALAVPDVGVQFNLSHSADIALIGVGKDRRVGVDVNHTGRTSGWEAIVKRTFTVTEQNSFFAQPKEFQEEIFYRVWSQKEAYTKAIGDGFSYGFKNFTVVVDAEGGAGLLADSKSPGSVDEWHIVSIDVGSDCVATLAYDGAKTPGIRQWEFVPRY